MDDEIPDYVEEDGFGDDDDDDAIEDAIEDTGDLDEPKKLESRNKFTSFFRNILLFLTRKKGISFGKYSFEFTSIPFPCIDPEFHSRALDKGEIIQTYLSLIECCHGGFVMCVNLFLYFYFMLVVAFDDNFRDAWIYNLLGFFVSILLPCLYPFIGGGKYLIYQVYVRSTGKLKRVVGLFYIFFSIVGSLILVYFFLGGFSGVGLYHAVYTGIKMKEYFMIIILFVLILVFLCSWCIQFFLNGVVLMLMLIKICVRGGRGGGGIPGGDEEGVFDDIKFKEQVDVEEEGEGEIILDEEDSQDEIEDVKL